MSDEKDVFCVTKELGLRPRSLRERARADARRASRRPPTRPEYHCRRDPKVLAKIREDVFDVGAPSDGGS